MSGYSVHNYWKTKKIDPLQTNAVGLFVYPPLTSSVEAQLAALSLKRDPDKKATAKADLADDEREQGEEPAQRIDKTQLRAIQSMNRMNNWAMAAVDDPRLLENLQQGLVLKHSVHKHEFRDRNKTLEKSAIPFMPKQ